MNCGYLESLAACICSPRGRFGNAIALIVFALCLPSISFAQDGSQACDRQCLIKFMDQYVDHLVKHDPAGLPVAPNANIRENTSPVKLGDGAWKEVTGIKARQEFADPQTGNVVFRGAVDVGATLGSMAIRLKIVKGKITESETVLNAGKGPFDPDYLLEPDALFDSPVPVGRRSTREQMIKVADNYFEAIGTHNPSIASFAKRCERFESGRRMTNNPHAISDESGAESCGESLVNLKGEQTIQRRYPLVDVERGIVIGYTFIEHNERKPPQSLYMSEMFKIVDGKLREIENISYTVPAPPDSGYMDK
jgi:hypothetical protein